MSATFAKLPPADAPVFYVGAPQGQLGPMTLDALLDQFIGEQVAPEAPVWFEGLPNWIRLGEHPELRARLAAKTSAPPAAAPADDAPDHLFARLIKGSWDYYHANLFAEHVDEVFIGAVISSTLDNGYSLIDIASDGARHYLRFENLQDRTRVIYQLRHLATDVAAAKVLGHMAGVVVGYGERVGNLGRIWGAVKAEYKSGYLHSAEPGTITVDADLESGYIYAQVDMFWNISDYVANDYMTDSRRLTQHIGACVHALRKYLHGRIGQ